jgi:hypothetical protein
MDKTFPPSTDSQKSESEFNDPVGEENPIKLLEEEITEYYESGLNEENFGKDS